MMKENHQTTSLTIYINDREMVDKIKRLKGDYSISKYGLRAIRRALEEDEKKLPDSRIGTPQSQAAESQPEVAPQAVDSNG